MNEISRVQKGEEARTEYANRLRERSIRLSRIDSRVKFRTDSGKIAGIPYASEKPRRPNRWFLGLPDQRFDFVILLCETDTGTLLDFVFTPNFVSEIWPSLSVQDSIRQVKFEVCRRSVDDYELKVKGGIAKKIRRFLGHVEILTG
jgi:hypothetical protein